jgi:PAS domain-containing protein
MEQTADEITRLQGCINDLISVLALPAMWSGQESSQIVSTLLDVLVGMLRLDFAYVRLSEAIDGSPIELIRLAPRRSPATQPQEVSRALNRWLMGAPPASPCVVPNPVGAGEVSIIPLRLGLQEDVGVLVAGSQRADFPTEIERLLLRVAVNQAGIGLREARFLSEQRRAAEAIRFQAGLLAVVDQAVLATDTHGVITYWNRFAEHLYGSRQR